MNADLAFARKELMEYVRTWRLKLLVIPTVFFALSGPIFAFFTPEILSAALGSESAAFGTLPDATWQDAFLQWTNNLQQIIPLLIIVIAAGAIAGECSTGTIVPVISGGYPHARIVVIKWLIHTMVGIVVIAVGTVLTWGVGKAIFPDTSWHVVPDIILVASLVVILLTSLSVLASSKMADTMGAVGVSVAGFFALAGLSLWQSARDWTPVGLLPRLTDAANGTTTGLLWPALTTIALAVLMVAGAIQVFRNREL